MAKRIEALQEAIDDMQMETTVDAANSSAPRAWLSGGGMGQQRLGEQAERDERIVLLQLASPKLLNSMRGFAATSNLTHAPHAERIIVESK